MFSEDQRIIARIAPALQRVLIVDPQPASARMLADLIRNFVPCQVWVAASKPKAVELLQAVSPQIVFVELAGPGLDGIELTRQLRRSEFTCRQVPVIMATANATAQAILAARDAGVHEFLAKPYTTKDLLRRLEAVALKPRNWVEAVGYVGPDRRRFNSGAYAGKRKRGVDVSETPAAAKIAQACKILRSAAAALAGDPEQALRSMRAQAVVLHEGGLAVQDPRLAGAAAEFHRYLAGLKAITLEDSTEVADKARALLRLAPSEAAPELARQAA